MGADNQQERLNAQWITGFVDGEGCFYVGINKIRGMRMDWQVLPEFRVVQHKRDIDVLYRIRDTLGCGKVCQNHGDRFEVRVRGLKDLRKLIKFFKKYPLQTTKRANFEKFCQIISLMENGEHLTKKGLDEIGRIIHSMNEKVKPAYLVSSETLCRTPPKGVKIKSEPHGDVRRQTEMPARLSDAFVVNECEE